MKKAGYQYILEESKPNEKSFAGVCAQLVEAKKSFMSMNKNDFLKMYPILKKLLFCYMDYIKFSIDYGSDMDEGDFLPGTIDEMEAWLRELNTWFPIKINGEWKNCTGQYIGVPEGFEDIVERFQEITKFKRTPIFSDNTVPEPYIGEEENKKITFGFVNMENAEKSEVTSNFKVFELECPEECTKEKRKWVCTKCGGFVQYVDLTLHCSCGSKRYRERLLICHHPSHQSRSIKKVEIQKFMHPPAPDTEIESDQNLTDGDLLPIICQQLRKIRNNQREATDPKIFMALVDLLSGDKEQEEIENILRELHDLEFLCGDTRHIIHQYFNRNK